MNGNIAKVVQQEMDSRGWTQQILEDKSGISQATISRVLDGKNVKLNTVRRLFEALELPFCLDIYTREQLLLIATTLKSRT